MLSGYVLTSCHCIWMKVITCYHAGSSLSWTVVFLNQEIVQMTVFRVHLILELRPPQQYYHEVH